MKPIIEFDTPETNPKKQKRQKRKINNSPFNTILFIILAIIIIYMLVKGFIWAWNTLDAWETL